MGNLNNRVTEFLDELNHPLRQEIEYLRNTIVSSTSGLNENIKWNGPNYCYQGADRITMKIQPPKQIQLIFHRGSKKLDQPKERIISTNSSLIAWRENDRAIATFKTMKDIEVAATELIDIISKWISATK